MRTTVLKATATVALFVAGLASAVAQERTDNPPIQLRDRLAINDLPESERAAALRIVGGWPTTIENNPWQVALIQGRMAEPIRSQFCGGSIIDAEWVITAAHCMDNFIVNNDPARVNIVAGTTSYRQGGQRVAVKQIFVHPSWNRNNNDNDVALLQLSRRLTTGESVRTIQLAAAGTTFNVPIPLQVTGWGVTDPKRPGSGSSELMAAIVPLVPNNVCNEKDSYAGRITANMFCAGFRDGGFDSCQGDSGGPVWLTMDKKETLLGVVSFGEGCAKALKYGVYTRVANYNDWVQRTMRDLPGAVRENEFVVNESEWSQVPEEQRAQIEVILRESRLIEPDVTIVPKSDAERLIDGGQRLSLGGAAKWVCRRACEASAATAVAACGTLTAGVGVPVCVAAAERGTEWCKKACNR